MSLHASLKNAQISARIIKLVADGSDLRSAFDAVLGNGAYSKLADEIYEAARAKAAQS